MRLMDGSPGLWVYPVELNYLTSFAPRLLHRRVRQLGRQMLSTLPWNKEGCQQRHRTVFEWWASNQWEELTHVYVDGLIEPIQIKDNPIEIIRNQTGKSLQNDLFIYLDAVQECFDNRASSAQPLLVFKSTEAADVERYDRLFPEMRFVHIVRHPHWNYASLKRGNMILKRQPFWQTGGDILREHVEGRWIPHVRFVLRALATEPQRNFLVKYEDLCERPEEVMADLCRWLNVMPPTNSTLLTVLGGKQMKELPDNSSREGLRTPSRVVRKLAGQFGYENDVVTEREKEFIRVRTFPLAHRIGYFSEKEPVPGRLELARKWLAPDRWELMNVHSRFRLVVAFLARRLYIFRTLLLASR